MALRKQTQICIFEDNFSLRLLPLVYFRPVYKLKCGAFSLLERIELSYSRAPVTLHCRSYLADIMRERNPKTSVNVFSAKSYLFLNGRIIAGSNLAKAIPLEGPSDIIYTKGDVVVAARISGTRLARFASRIPDLIKLTDFDGTPRKEIEIPMISYPWDLISQNGVQIRADWPALLKSVKGKKMRATVHSGVHLLNRKDIIIGQGSVVKPGVVIDAEEGPVYIGKNVTIMPQATIIGPVFIGEGSTIKVGAKIYEDTTIGPMCKVGGEVEASIIHGYSNKQHDGFLGHSYIGAWVNLGAGTTNSDLKNNYGTVRVVINGETVDSGLQFVGVMIGDHTKTAIQSVLNTGTVIGVASNIFGSGIPPKFVPSFSWGAAGSSRTTHDCERAVESAQRAMARRKVKFSGADAALFRKVFKLTEDERHRADAVKG